MEMNVWKGRMECMKKLITFLSDSLDEEQEQRPSVLGNFNQSSAKVINGIHPIETNNMQLNII